MGFREEYLDEDDARRKASGSQPRRAYLIGVDNPVPAAPDQGQVEKDRQERTEYPRSCKWCSAPIVMRKRIDGNWGAFEPGSDNRRHHCSRRAGTDDAPLVIPEDLDLTGIDLPRPLASPPANPSERKRKGKKRAKRATPTTRGSSRNRSTEKPVVDPLYAASPHAARQSPVSTVRQPHPSSANRRSPSFQIPWWIWLAVGVALFMLARR